MSQSVPATYAAGALRARHAWRVTRSWPTSSTHWFLVGLALVAVAVVFGDDELVVALLRDRPGHRPRHLRPHGDGRLVEYARARGTTTMPFETGDKLLRWSWRPCTTARRRRAALDKLAGGLVVVAVVLGHAQDGHRPGGAGRTRCRARPPRSSPMIRHAARARPGRCWPRRPCCSYGLLRPSRSGRTRCGRSRDWRWGCWPASLPSRTTSRPPPWSTHCREAWPGGPAARSLGVAAPAGLVARAPWR